MRKHTPGPWSCWSTSNHAHDYRLFKPNGAELPYVAPGNDHSEARANARLIAAAPDMLDILRAALDPERDDHADALNMARDLIKKIDGGTK